MLLLLQGMDPVGATRSNCYHSGGSRPQPRQLASIDHSSDKDAVVAAIEGGSCMYDVDKVAEDATM